MLTLQQHLEQNPWPEKWSALGTPVENFWSFELEVSIEKLWPYLADTSNYGNRMMGLPEAFYTESEGRLIGRTKDFPAMEWEEFWEWEYGRQTTGIRVFHSGPLHVLRGQLVLERLESERVRLYVYLGLLPKNRMMGATLRIISPLMEKKTAKVWWQITEYAREGYRIENDVQPLELSASAQSKISQIRQKLAQLQAPSALTERLLEHVCTAHELELDRIRPRFLAGQWQVDLQELICVCLHAVHAGLFILSWDVICPHCRGVRQGIRHLRDIPANGSCDVCEIRFETSTATALEVSFQVHPSVRKIEKKVYCVAEAAKKPFVKFQLQLKAGESRILENRWKPGRYRLRSRGQYAYNLLEITPDKSALKSITLTDSTAGTALQISPETALEFQNNSDVSKWFVLEEHEIDQSALRPVDLFGCPEFRTLFPDEVVASGMRLDIGEQTICFTDIVGSTQFYVMKGDTGAFAVIHRHFVKVYDVVEQNGGVVVKSIGDAVMAAFHNAADSLRAAVELQRHFSQKTLPPDVPAEDFVRLRIALHQGPCLAVNLNNGIDYFGNTVNLTSKLQEYASADQIVFTETVLHDSTAAEYLKDFPEMEKLEYTHEALAEPLPIFRMRISN